MIDFFRGLQDLYESAATKLILGMIIFSAYQIGMPHNLGVPLQSGGKLIANPFFSIYKSIMWLK